jgi:hypothetical protein
MWGEGGGRVFGGLIWATCVKPESGSERAEQEHYVNLVSYDSPALGVIF